MKLFWNRNKTIRDEQAFDKKSSIEVTSINRKAHQTAKQAERDIEKLNRLLRADGITLKIYIAGGGHHGK